MPPSPGRPPGCRLATTNVSGIPCGVLLFFALLLFSSPAGRGQVLTHGPVVGGVTPSEANVFIRTDTAATVTLRYGTDPSLSSYLTSDPVQTDVSNDFTKIIGLNNLEPEKPVTT